MSPSEKILCLDTTGSELMLALAEGSAFRFQHRERSESQRYHSAMLIPLMQRALTEAGWNLSELSALAINVGPGSFTGIRTGITSIRLMGQFLDLPVHVFNTFQLLAAKFPGESVTVLLDALRGRVYHAVLTVGPQSVTYQHSPSLIPLESVPLPEGRLLVAESLCARLPEAFPPAIALESLQCFTPDEMLTLVDRCPEAFKTAWDSVLPLYLQEPNITQRKPLRGGLRPLV